MHTILENVALERDNTAIAPWFSTYNSTIGMPSSARVFPLDPFPSLEFCGFSPWDEHIILAHDGVSPYAKKAGFESVDQYLLWLIRESPKRGEFCKTCPNRQCAQSYE